MAYATARADLQSLQMAGLLVQSKSGKQKLLYFRAEDFAQRLAELKNQPLSVTIAPRPVQQPDTFFSAVSR